MRVENIINENVKEKREVDFYIPVKIEYDVNDDGKSGLFYYRLLNSQSSFIEMTINSETRKIVSITIISVNNIGEPDEIILNNVARLGRIGNPIIDMIPFQTQNIVTEENEFRIVCLEHKICILLEEKNVVDKVVMDNTALLLDKDDNIAGFIFEGFSREEWNELQQSIEHSA